MGWSAVEGKVIGSIENGSVEEVIGP